MLRIFNKTYPECSKTYFNLNISNYEIPCCVVAGKNDGKTILITGQIHSGEYVGTPAIIRLCKMIDPAKVKGNLICFPCVNISGFWQNSNAYVPEDHGNLNSNFPGNDCNVSGRIAKFFVEEIFPKVDFVLDLHCGGNNEILTPCLFFPTNEKVKSTSIEIAKNINIPYLLPSSSKKGLFSYASNVMNIPSLLLERGYASILKEEWVEDYLNDILLALNALGLIENMGVKNSVSHTVFDEVIYQNSDEDALWYPNVDVGSAVKKGDYLGHLEDFRGNVLKKYYALDDAVILYYRASLNAPKDHNIVTYGLLRSCHQI